MEKDPTKPRDLPVDIQKLEKQLLAGETSPEVFILAVQDMDQSTPTRESAVEAADILGKPEVVALFLDTEYEAMFYGIRSLTYFHRAQIRIMKGDGGYLADFKSALEDSEKGGERSEDWSNYIQATIAYLNNDLDELKKYAEKLILNKGLVQNFIGGLEERGQPKYLDDYSKPRTGE
jgi:hypothetical protein